MSYQMKTAWNAPTKNFQIKYSSAKTRPLNSWPTSVVGTRDGTTLGLSTGKKSKRREKNAAKLLK